MSRGKTILSMIAVFVSGIIVGGLLTAAGIRRQYHRYIEGGPLASRQFVVAALGHELKLTPGQRAALSPIIGETQARLLAIRNRVEPEVAGVFTNAMADMKKTMDAEQGRKLDALYERIKTRWAPPAKPPATVP
jgi:hypothetical protein